MTAGVRRRALGRTGLQVSELGYGAWGIGGALWTGGDDEAAVTSLRKALDRGVNFFDTAYVYGDGHSEELIARALKGRRDEALLATKAPPKNGEWPSKGTVREAYPGDWIVRCTERSLKRLKTATLDLQQLHVWRDSWMTEPGWDDTLAGIERLKKAGKVRFWGVSVDSRAPRSALALAGSGLIDSVQVIFNLFEQEPLDTLFPVCRKHGVGVIARVPFDEGGLTGALRADTRFPEGDFRARYFAGGLLQETVRRAQKLEKALVPGEGPTLAHAALRYCLSSPDVSTVIPGMRDPRHVEANAAAAAAPPLRPKLLKALRAHAWKRTL